MSSTIYHAVVLIVDDNPTNLGVLYDYLVELGFDVYVAMSGEKALEQAKRIQPDIILLDVLMPGIDGFETCRLLKEDPAFTEVPVIFMTALSDTVDKMRGFEVGAVDYVTKPFHHEEVLARVNAHLTIQLQKRKIRELSEKRLRDLRFNIAYSLPHELRTPLTVISGYAELLARGMGIHDANHVQSIGAKIDSAAQRLRRLIENYRFYAELELMATQQDENARHRLETISYPASLIGTVAAAKAEEYQRAADLQVISEDEVLQISPEHLTKILEELIDNAFHFSVAGTPVVITTDSSSDEHFFGISITNHGIGMYPEQIENIAAFMQFDRQMHEQQGSGLGLVIAKSLVEFHQGMFTIESTPGEQITVTVKLRRK